MSAKQLSLFFLLTAAVLSMMAGEATAKRGVTEAVNAVAGCFTAHFNPQKPGFGLTACIYKVFPGMDKNHADKFITDFKEKLKTKEKNAVKNIEENLKIKFDEKIIDRVRYALAKFFAEDSETEAADSEELKADLGKHLDAKVMKNWAILGEGIDSVKDDYRFDITEFVKDHKNKLH